MELTKEFVNKCKSITLLRDFLCQAIDQVDTQEQHIRELEKDNLMYRKIVDENSLRAKIDLWEKDVAELESKLTARDERIKELENKVQILITENNILENKLRQAESTLVQWSK